MKPIVIRSPLLMEDSRFCSCDFLVRHIPTLGPLLIWPWPLSCLLCFVVGIWALEIGAWLHRTLAPLPYWATLASGPLAFMHLGLWASWGLGFLGFGPLGLLAAWASDPLGFKHFWPLGLLAHQAPR